MRIIALAVASLFAAICHATPAPQASSAPPEWFLAPCKQTCERQNMMRAVGAQVIALECERGCVQEWSLPLMTTKKSLSEKDKQRVRVVGTLKGNALVLPDGASLALSGPAVEAAPSVGESRAMVVGTWQAGALSSCTTIAKMPAAAP